MSFTKVSSHVSKKKGGRSESLPLSQILISFVKVTNSLLIDLRCTKMRLTSDSCFKTLSFLASLIPLSKWSL